MLPVLEEMLGPRVGCLCESSAQARAVAVVKRLVKSPFAKQPWERGWWVGEEEYTDGVQAVYNEGDKYGLYTLSIVFHDVDSAFGGHPSAASISVSREETKLGRLEVEYSSESDMKRVIQKGLALFRRKAR